MRKPKPAINATKLVTFPESAPMVERPMKGPMIGTVTTVEVLVTFQETAPVPESKEETELREETEDPWETPNAINAESLDTWPETAMKTEKVVPNVIAATREDTLPKTAPRVTERLPWSATNVTRLDTSLRNVQTDTDIGVHVSFKFKPSRILGTTFLISFLI